ncbi:hypothetical protein CKN99_00900 [Carnobacterium maltaromaticum]|nr:hypothetical protein CKN90_00900 [Carnobacterium maltaromaticum]TFJ35645.1 hypothetical protein CKN98_00900 [Carnobacterium maltaromaticum]TFJ39462.1 hypothetical protein CKN88_00900 [Carnobacterium maltaromaticum]TFJ41556.1 hypothetical protein CKN99_00900 [Carnobacterium maltaromaticum]TFJ49546.1 hypothetical protein CKN92_00335 [Carnobacterium maltaromaticum]
MTQQFNADILQQEIITFKLLYKGIEIKPKILINMVELVWNHKLDSQSNLNGCKPVVFHLNHVRVDIPNQRKGLMTCAVCSCILIILQKAELLDQIIEVNLVHSMGNISSIRKKNNVYKKLLKEINNEESSNAVRYQVFYPNKRNEDIDYYSELLAISKVNLNVALLKSNNL